MKKRIVIFDDNKEHQESVCELISNTDNLICVGKFNNTFNCVKIVRDCNPNLILMDLDMPESNGIEGTSLIKRQYPEVPIVIQTVYDDNNSIFEALKAGANGYLIKSTDPELFIKQINEALEGGPPMSRYIAIKVLDFFNENKIEEDYNLTKSEKQVLKYMVDGYSYKMIAAEKNLSYNTICNHVANIYKKLQVNSATGAVSLALKRKLV